MSKEQVYNMMKAEGYLPGSMRWRHGSLNEHENEMDTIRFTTPDGRSFVAEYHTHTEANRTFSDVYDITEIDSKAQMIKG